MWTEKDNSLQRSFKFKNFIEAFAFMTEVAFHAEQQNHHPNWSNVYDTVDFQLNTHDADDSITEKDRKLAAAIDSVYTKFAS